MVSINIAKGQGLTQALKSYAQSQNLDTSKITKADWYRTIDKLKELQQKREENNQESIYFNSNMLVYQGPKNFSEEEIDALFETMGLKVAKTTPQVTENKGTAFDEWSKKATEDSNFSELFRISGAKTIDGYNKDLAKLAEDYIKLYDKNGDNVIDEDEYKSKEMGEDMSSEQYQKDMQELLAKAEADRKQLVAQGKDTKEVDELIADIKAQKDIDFNKLYQDVFNRLNVDNEGTSKGVLTQQEVMNMFFTMDAENDLKAGENERGLAQGTISNYEFNRFREKISSDNPSFVSRMKTFYNDLFKNWK